MGGFQIPRAQRQVDDPTQVRRGRFEAPTAGFQAQQQLGSAIVQAGQAAGQIGARHLAARERMARERVLNRSTAAANEIRQDLVEFKAKELNAVAGLDTEGNVERLEVAYSNSIVERTAELTDEEKVFVNQELQADVLKDRTNFAIHQQKQLKGEVFSNLDQSLNTAVQEAAANPSVGTIEEKLKSHALTVFKFKAAGSIDQEEAEDRITEGREAIIKSAVIGASLQNPELAQDILDEMKSVLPAETVKTLEADIRSQTKIQNDAAEEARTESVQTFTNQVIDLTEQGTATVTAAQASPIWSILEPDERKAIMSIIEDGSPFNESNEVVLADFTTRINVDPDSVSVKELVSAHGRKKNGISTADFNKLFKQKQARTGKAETPQESAIKQAYTILDNAKSKKIFDSSDEAVNAVEWSRATQTLDIFVQENPDAEPGEYTDLVEGIISPKERGTIDAVFDFFGGELSAGATTSTGKERNEAIKRLQKANMPITEGNITAVTIQLREQEDGE